MPADHVLISRYLDTVGDGSGTKNAVGDYSGAGDEDFMFTATEDTNINRMLISYEDTSGFQANEYGDSGSALTEGILVRQYNSSGNVVVDLTDGVPIKTNAEWGALCYDVEVKAWGATPTNELLVARWTFGHSGQPLHLHDGESLRVTLRDSMTFLVSHFFLLQGYIR